MDRAPDVIFGMKYESAEILIRMGSSVYLADMKFHYMTTLTHWGRVRDICAGDLNINGSDHGLSPGWRQAII